MSIKSELFYLFAVLAIESLYQYCQVELHEIERSIFAISKCTLLCTLIRLTFKTMYNINIENDLIELAARLVLYAKNSVKFNVSI